jgi:hypothetical protein
VVLERNTLHYLWLHNIYKLRQAAAAHTSRVIKGSCQHPAAPILLATSPQVAVQAATLHLQVIELGQLAGLQLLECNTLHPPFFGTTNKLYKFKIRCCCCCCQHTPPGHQMQPACWCGT